MASDQTLYILSFTLLCLLSFSSLSVSDTQPDDVQVLNDFKLGLENPELLNWPAGADDPCFPHPWPHVVCSGNRVTGIRAESLGLKGRLPGNFNQLSSLPSLELQNNNIYGKLPSFQGLSNLEYAYLSCNAFESIPFDFFDGLINVKVIELDHNPLNKSSGWSIPQELEHSVKLMELSLVNCSLVGQVPVFLSSFPTLTALKLSYNRLSGVIPASFGQSVLQVLWLNDQDGGGLSGSIDVIASIVSLKQVWLQGNGFTGTMPRSILDLTELEDLKVNRNQLVGTIPHHLASMPFKKLDLSNNLFMGPIPTFKQSAEVNYAGNSFCQTSPGTECAPQVAALTEFAKTLNYPTSLASEWSGNDPCSKPWFGIGCDSKSRVSVINLPSLGLNGSVSPSIAKLDSLVEIRLGGNNLTGTIPTSLAQLRFLKLLDLARNNLDPPLPKFNSSVVKVNAYGNPRLSGYPNASDHSALPFPQPVPADIHTKLSKIRRLILVLAIVGVVAILVLVLLVIFLRLRYTKLKRNTGDAVSTGAAFVYPWDPENLTGVEAFRSSCSQCMNRCWALRKSTETSGAGHPTLSVKLLRKVTDNFAPENELGRGGFGVVYKGRLGDGLIAVKRMIVRVVGSKQMNQFHSEILVLSKVRHRHLVSLFGYAVESDEKLLVYEYMPKGALNKHLFHWRKLNWEPLSWPRRIIIALDVARGMEYLHTFANQCFIHRDLKPSNILLSDDYHAKVSDFGLVKLVPDTGKSVETKIAGTYGYLAPEYTARGKITTKADIYSFGVVLMELLTGKTALDEDRSEESRYIVEWFLPVSSDTESLMSIIDPTIEANDDTRESLLTVAELAKHCTEKDPAHRPDMSYAVHVLGSLVEHRNPIKQKHGSCTTTQDDADRRAKQQHY